jgi:hypothetical protein
MLQIFWDGLYVGLMLSFQGSRGAAQCTENMRQIGIALHHYHDEHGSFPPAYTVCAEGKPLHSWRTLILPHFNSEVIEPKWKEIYEQIRFDEPWDSEANILFSQSITGAHAATDYQRLRYNMPVVYGCPMCCSGATEAQTPYKMIVGNNAVGSLTGTSRPQMERPAEETILLIESGAPVQWTSPADFTESDFQTAVFASDSKQVREITLAHRTEPSSTVAKRQFLGGKHQRELHILFADGTVKTFLDGELSLSEIERMSKIRE